MNHETNVLNWFEIPVTDFIRAKHFYQVVFGIHMDEMEVMGMRMAVFPSIPGNGKVSGAIVQSEQHIPNREGTLVYLNANPNLAEALQRAEEMGGRILMHKTNIGNDIGYMAIFEDTEGNRVAMHSNA